MPAACSGFRVWPYADHFLLEPLDGRDGTLRIGRKDGKVSAGAEPSLSSTVGEPFSACILVGIIDLLSGPYLLLVTNSVRVGSLHGGHVFLVTETKLLRASTAALTPAQEKDEAQYVERLERALKEHGLYYSYSADITTRSQNRRQLAQTLSPDQPLLWQQADHRLVWNSSLLSSIASVPEAAPYLVPVVQGMAAFPLVPARFQFIEAELNGQAVKVSVLARRATSRIGTRMWRRGADSLGNVANFVESEQLLQTGSGYTASYIQVRGSIPIHWEQVVDLTYKPKIKPVGPHPGSTVPLHVSILREEYGSVVAVDLVNQKGGELKIGSAYAQAVDTINAKEEKAHAKHPLKYVAFDFHHVCGHSKFERLESLYDDIAKTVEEQGYFLTDPAGKVLATQAGVVRTNCVDCLDRTNVTQSLLGRKVLEKQLVRLGVLKAGETVKSHEAFNSAYKIAWANHGDDISKQYSGTGALKGDFVRYGKRSLQGMAQDGVNSLMRYVYNNFYDGVRQDGLDLVMGNYTVDPSKPSPFVKKGLEAYTHFSAALFLLLGALVVTFDSILEGIHGKSSEWLTAILAAALFVAIGYIMKKYGRLFCDRPRLSSLK